MSPGGEAADEPVKDWLTQLSLASHHLLGAEAWNKEASSREGRTVGNTLFLRGGARLREAEL